MFTPGRIVFTAVFMLAFAIYLVWAYRKDAMLQKKYYRGTLYILLILIAIWIAFYTFVKLT